MMQCSITGLPNKAWVTDLMPDCHITPPVLRRSVVSSNTRTVTIAIVRTRETYCPTEDHRPECETAFLSFPDGYRGNEIDILPCSGKRAV